MLAVGVVVSGGLITAMVHVLGTASGEAAARPALQTGSQVSLPLWLALGIVVLGSMAVGLTEATRRRRRTLARRLVQAREGFTCRKTEEILELLIAHHAASGSADEWEALLTAVNELQNELEACRPDGRSEEGILSGGLPSPQKVLEALDLGILCLEADRLVYANPAARRMLNLPFEARGSGRLVELVPWPGVAETILNLRHHVGETSIDCQLESAEGRFIVRMQPLAWEGDRSRLVVTIQDITAFKQSEQARDEFLAHLTHELRTPLTNIRAYAETLNNEIFDDEQTRRECYRVILKEVRRLAKLIEDVLSVSQVDAGAARLVRSFVRLEELLPRAVEEMQAAADAKGVELILDLAPQLPPVSGDRFRLLQTWLQLIGNAVKYTPAGGLVRVAAEAEGPVVRVRVEDTGVGIPPEWQERIFDKFFRIQAGEEEAAAGTGLGLAIVRDVIRLHGGTIRVESEPGRGTCFIVELPSAGAVTADKQGVS